MPGMASIGPPAAPGAGPNGNLNAPERLRQTSHGAFPARFPGPTVSNYWGADRSADLQRIGPERGVLTR
jgi:hypothetical protein